MIRFILEKHLLKNFFGIQLTSNERKIAEASFTRYRKIFVYASLHTLLILPALLLFEATLIAATLIPVTMVAGSAWFQISLSNMKQKFEAFGLELTEDVFKTFTTSLCILFFIALLSLNSSLKDSIPLVSVSTPMLVLAGLMGSYSIGSVIYHLFLGSLKFDINDSMLAGQQEAAEHYFRRSLTYLNQTSTELRKGKSLEIANYYIAHSFYDLFSYIVTNTTLERSDYESIVKLRDKAKDIFSNPQQSQDIVDENSIEFIETFMGLCTASNDETIQEHIEMIAIELECMKKNSSESQHIVDTRLATIFDKIGDMILKSGEALFEKQNATI